MIYRLRNYMTHPDQTFLRREAQWTFKFFVSFKGIILIFGHFFMVLVLSTYGEELMMNSGPNFFVTRLTSFAYNLLTDLFPILLWLYLFNRRILARFESEQMHDLASLPVTPRMIWPAFLAAPFLGVAMLAIAMRVLGGIYDLFTFGTDAYPTEFHGMAMVLLTMGLFQRFLSIISCLVITAWCTLSVIKHRTWFSVLLTAFLCHLALSFIQIVLAVIPAVFMFVLEDFNTVIMLMTFVSTPVTILIFSLLALSAIKKLRNPDIWRKTINVE